MTIFESNELLLRVVFLIFELRLWEELVWRLDFLADPSYEFALLVFLREVELLMFDINPGFYF